MFWTPTLMPVTFTAMVQESVAAIEPPTKLIVADPAVAVGVPPQVLERPFGVATASPAGSVSVKPTPVSPAVAFGLPNEKVSEVVPFRGMVPVPNFFEMVGGATTGIPVPDNEMVPELCPLIEKLVVVECGPTVCGTN